MALRIGEEKKYWENLDRMLENLEQEKEGEKKEEDDDVKDEHAGGALSKQKQNLQTSLPPKLFQELRLKFWGRVGCY